MSTEQIPSRQTLDEVPGRIVKFLIAAGESLPIRATLATKGYNDKEHEYAWGLLQKLAVIPSGNAPALDKAVRDAITELDAWDEPNFACIKAALERLHPEQAKFIFDNLEPKQGPESVVAVSTLLDRLDALHDSPDREATREADHAALDTLAGRGYTGAERGRLRGLIKTAQTVGVVAPLSNADRQATLVSLHAWLHDWSTSARAVIKRRDYLIRLGLAKPKKRVKVPAGTSTGGTG